MKSVNCYMLFAIAVLLILFVIAGCQHRSVAGEANQDALSVYNIGVSTKASAGAEQPENMPAPRVPSGMPDNSRLAARLESAGTSTEIREAVNNPIPQDAENELTNMLDKLESMPEGSAERAKLLKQIDEYVIPGANEAFSGEIQKEQAIDLAKEALLEMFALDISNWTNQISVRYMHAGLYAEKRQPLVLGYSGRNGYGLVLYFN